MSNVTITIEDGNVTVTENKALTAEYLYSTGAFDDLLNERYGRPPQKILSIKIVRKLTGEGLKAVKDAMDNRLDMLGTPRYGRLYY
jgi:ribosomal protein L7/L12